MSICNYMENLPKQQAHIEKLSMAQKFHDVFNKKLNLDQQITAYDSSYGIQKIFDLHMKKDYKPETLFIAAGILDRYIYMIGVQNFPKAQMVCLSTICVLLSAKVEQPISPSFNRLISLLTPEEQKYVSKPMLIELESEIIVRMGFDFNFPGPIQSMDRYLRILD